MTKRKRTRNQIVGLISLSLIIAAATYGFAEANTIGTTGLLGVGYGVLSDYQVSKVTYTLDEADPTHFVAVSFELDGLASSVAAGVSETKNGEIIWADGCQSTGYSWICSFDGSIDVLVADWLHVE
jgi:hypothetical protein